MITCQQFERIFLENDIDCFVGIPDSTFKDWIGHIENSDSFSNYISANECDAIAFAAGYNLATDRLCVVYLQNSGLGKTVNPLTSLCNRQVFSIPLILMIGLRGEPGTNDAPQHEKMGEITGKLLDLLEIPYEILSDEVEKTERQVKKIVETAKKTSNPAAVMIRRGLISGPPCQNKSKDFCLKREYAIKCVCDIIADKGAIVSSTGKISRELYEYRMSKNLNPDDFYMIGSMGCASSIALGISLNQPDKRIFVLDGDGSIIMQMGSLTTIGHFKPKNFYHIIFDNESYESTGGQKTASETMDLCNIAKSCGYADAFCVDDEEGLKKQLVESMGLEGSIMLVIKVGGGSRGDLKRPREKPVELKDAFKEKIQR